ncbi:MAG: DNA polymerase I [Bacteroidales bacterium]
MPLSGKFFILDAMALIYRAFYAMIKNPRINSKGLNTGAILGFTNTLYEVLQKENPTHIAVAFDLQAPTLRHDEFEAYKANRQAMPEDLAASIPWIKELVTAFHIAIVEKEGYEADDIMGTLAVKATAEGMLVYLMSSDKDLGQLVNDRIFLYRPGRFGGENEIMGPAEVCQKFGVQHPAQIIDLLAIMGDSSDNIPGVKGIGEKGALELIQQFGTLENVLQNLDKVAKPKIRALLEEQREQALQSKRLATIITDVPIPFDPQAFRRREPDIPRLKALFNELEFRTLARRVFNEPEDGQLTLFDEAPEKLEKPEKQTIHNTPHEYLIADTPEKLKDLVQQLINAQEFCFDTETTGTDPNSCELVGLSFAVKPHHAWYVPCPPDYNETLKILEILRPAFENPRVLKVGQNMKFDLMVLHYYDIHPSGPFFDTMLAHYVLEPEQRHNMDYLAHVYLNYEPVPIESLIGQKGAKQGSMRDVDLALIKEYAAEDADITLQLKQKLEPLLSQAGVEKLFNEIEMPLMPVLASMEIQGVKIDVENLRQLSQSLDKDLAQIENEIYELAGEKFNISSPRQLGIILFEKLKIDEKPRLTATKQYATGEDVLEKLAGKHPIVGKILDYRELIKLKSTYVDTLPQMINPRTGRIHTSYNQAVTSTGRLSSTNPNLQNIPVRTERGREIRRAFIPRNPDYILLAADYSQIELRIIAHLSGDQAMQDAFRFGFDIHAATAAKIFKVPLEEVTREQRRAAKSVNFGIVYGISAFGLSQNIGISKREAQQIIDEYFRQYPGIKAYMEKSIEMARQKGYVETLMGRRRYLPDIHSANANMRGFAERNAINAPIQGSAADMIKMAMINIHQELRNRNLSSWMVLQVHDELVFDVRRSELEVVKPLVHDLMKNALPLCIPVEVDVNTGENWLEAH